MTEEELLELKNKILTNLNAALGSSPMPSYEIDGRKFDWNGYIKALREQLAWVNEQLNALPVEEVTMYLDPDMGI